MNQKQLQEVYAMVDSIDFSRAKKNINRDFADCVMMAELIHYYNPKIISVHNYPSANSLAKKIQNWNTLNIRVLKKIGIQLNKPQIEDIVNGVPGAIQDVLYQILIKFQRPEEEESLMINARKMAGMGKDIKHMSKLAQVEQKSFKNKNKNHYQINPQQTSPYNINYQENPTLAPPQYQQNISANLYQALSGNNFTNLLEQQERTNLKDKIQKAYVQLNKLNQLNKVKQDVIRNLQKKLEKYIFS